MTIVYFIRKLLRQLTLKKPTYAQRLTRLAVPIVLLATLSSLVGCSYLATMASQAGLSFKNDLYPQQRTFKHLLSENKFLVFGELEFRRGLNRDAMAVLAISDAFSKPEVVDVNHLASSGSYYGLHLPAGRYTLVAVIDVDGNGIYEPAESVGQRFIQLSEEVSSSGVVGGQDINLERDSVSEFDFAVPVKPVLLSEQSLFYPRGTIRSLEDPIFEPEMGTLGLYKPAAFMEAAPMLFYAVEEDIPYRIPVIFVHGIEGSPRGFEEILNTLDRSRYRPWFFYYPSGMDLSQAGSMFYEIFLSGKVIPLGDMPVAIVAHSMGGLVAREALNHLKNRNREAHVARLITLASPLGGHPKARGAETAPVVVPSWRDISPDSEFMTALYRKELPIHTQHHLYAAYQETGGSATEVKGDGVVPSSSQLHAKAVKSAEAVHEYDANHVGILSDDRVMKQLLLALEAIENPYPESHLHELIKGGFGIELGADFTPYEAYVIDNFGHYLAALALGKLPPTNARENDFVAVAQERQKPAVPLHFAWIKFVNSYSDWPSFMN